MNEKHELMRLADDGNPNHFDDEEQDFIVGRDPGDEHVEQNPVLNGIADNANEFSAKGLSHNIVIAPSSHHIGVSYDG